MKGGEGQNDEEIEEGGERKRETQRGETTRAGLRRKCEIAQIM